MFAVNFPNTDFFPPREEDKVGGDENFDESLSNPGHSGKNSAAESQTEIGAENPVDQ